MISFFVSGTPKGQPRPRAFARRFGNKWQARVYDASTAEGWKSQIAAAIKPLLPNEPIEGPVSLCIALQLSRPKAHYLKSGLRVGAPTYNITKPDADNYAKSVMDALTAVGLWRDDNQVADLRVIKRYGERPGAQISIDELPVTEEPVNVVEEPGTF